MKFDKRKAGKYLLLLSVYFLICIGFGYYSAKANYDFDLGLFEMVPMLVLGTLSIMSLLSFPLLLVTYGPASFTKRFRKHRKNILLSCILLWFVTLSLGASFRLFSGYYAKQTYTSGEKLIDALEQYKRDNGVYPANLSVLIPQYLAEIPKTSKGNEYKYSSLNTTYGIIVNEDFGWYSYNKTAEKWIFHD